MIYPLIACLFLSYVFLAIEKDRGLDILAVIVFALTAWFLRVYVPFESNADYANYFARNLRLSLTSQDIFEPMTKLVYSLAHIFAGNNKDSLDAVYWFNFVISTLFFTYVGLYRGLSSIIKVLFFSLYYFFSTYVVIRNAPLYYILVIALMGNKRLSPKLALFMLSTHVSAISVVVMYYLHRKSSYKIFIFSLILVLCGVITVVYYSSSLFVGELALYKSYFEVHLNASVSHWILFVFNIGLVFIVVLLSRLRSFTQGLFMAFCSYACAFYINPIIASRLSIYMIVFLFFSTFDHFLLVKGIRSSLVVFIFTCVFGLVYTTFSYFDVHI